MYTACTAPVRLEDFSTVLEGLKGEYRTNINEKLWYELIYYSLNRMNR